MSREKIKTAYPGVRYREHPSRKSGRGLDRYFTIRYRNGKKQVEEGVGWSSESVDAAYAARLLHQIKHNIRVGDGFQSLAERRALLEADEQLRAETLVEERRLAYTFGDAAEAYLREHVNKASNKDDRRRFERHLKKSLGRQKLHEIRGQDIRALGRKLEKTRTQRGDGCLSPQSVHHCLALVRRIFNFSQEICLPGTDTPIFNGANPVQGKFLPKLDNTRWRVLTEEESAVVLEALAEPHPDAGVNSRGQAGKLRLISELSLETGARLSEILELRTEHVLPGSGLIRLVDTKHGSRSVYPGEELLGTLKAIKEKAGSDYLFPGRNLNPHLSKHYVTKAFSRVVNLVGLNDGVQDRRGRITFHTLRHTYGTRQIMAGMDVYTLSRLMGHAHLSTTERYLHLAEDFKAQQAARVRARF